MNRAFVNILSNNVENCAAFYETLLDMTRHADFGWFVILTHPEMPGYEFGILDQSHHIVPSAVPRTHGGIFLTFVVEDVHSILKRAQRLSADILEPPKDMPYGQTRMVLRDPDGTFVDISSPTPA